MGGAAMSSKTKIVVLHTKEVIYTGIFVVLAVVLAVLLFLMFGKNKNADPASADAIYHAGVYTSPITLNDNTFDVEVKVDENHINSISLVNLSETTTAMYPLVEPALDALSDQIYTSQSTENITYSEENKYTSMLLLEAIDNALDKARKE
ncbi:hypothetical protein BLAHAN_06419 [Blautia hansenii DSM 20583]|jgi:uncharacterized protein with FMN-binding domain|uniref:FMN-binding domain-containing protein n=2 Tax=Blautia hansenii TaxID=1322 RepID=C9LAG9_BLAHA|nr:hypothetical protein BLAHAN_06419 [Blautia hansenii DSM 20583]